ncbi:DUF3021 family protein [Sporosarcina obsidiansis]|uniref:DUF3021 family protein n=1 Tax=Sporosarcina obsidiansis TaxID=2660748 RepID=UPI00129BBC3C|nr:DUF3021 family protein [Sporosarcina obsidiansis]
MNRAMIYLGAACFAFTFSSIFYYIFRLFNIFPLMTEEMIVSLFIISCLITILIFLSHQLPIDRPLLIHLIEIVCVIVVLLIAGAVFEVYPFHAYYIGTVALCGLFAYTFVIIMIYMNNKVAEREINQSITQQKRSDLDV